MSRDTSLLDSYKSDRYFFFSLAFYVEDASILKVILLISSFRDMYSYIVSPQVVANL